MITVKSYTIDGRFKDSLPFAYEKESKLYVNNCHFSLLVNCEKDGRLLDLCFTFHAGLKYNGTSVPINVGFLKNYYGDVRDICGLCHDTLYAIGGECDGITLDAGECDDVFRGLLRETGFTRFQAGCMDRAVRTFAHCGHFGKAHDSEGMGELVEVKAIKF